MFWTFPSFGWFSSCARIMCTSGTHEAIDSDAGLLEERASSGQIYSNFMDGMQSAWSPRKTLRLSGLNPLDCQKTARTTAWLNRPSIEWTILGSPRTSCVPTSASLCNFKLFRRAQKETFWRLPRKEIKFWRKTFEWFVIWSFNSLEHCGKTSILQIVKIPDHLGKRIVSSRNSTTI